MAGIYIDQATARFIAECKSCWLSALLQDGTCRLETRLSCSALDPNTVVMADAPGRHGADILGRLPGWASFVDLASRQGLRLRGHLDTLELGQIGFLRVVAPLEAEHPGVHPIMSVTIFTVLEVQALSWGGPAWRVSG